MLFVLASKPTSVILFPFSVPKLVDLLVNNFPLSLLIFNVNFSLSADDLALLTVITPQQSHSELKLPVLSVLVSVSVQFSSISVQYIFYTSII